MGGGWFEGAVWVGAKHAVNSLICAINLLGTTRTRLQIITNNGTKSHEKLTVTGHCVQPVLRTKLFHDILHKTIVN